MHGVGATAPVSQYDPAGHDEHADWPSWLLYEPAAHGRGKVVPVQYAPVGQMYPVMLSCGRAMDAPPRQTKPASHTADAVLMPVKGQYIPKGHGMHTLLEMAWVAAEYVPMGHWVGAVEPAGQYEPAGHGPPISLTALEWPPIGVAIVAPVWHQYPSRHVPFDSAIPGRAHTLPPSHRVQADDELLPRY